MLLFGLLLGVLGGVLFDVAIVEWCGGLVVCVDFGSWLFLVLVLVIGVGIGLL